MSTQEPDTQPNKDRVHIWSIDISLWPYFVIPAILLIGLFVTISGYVVYSTYTNSDYKGSIWPLILTSFMKIGPIGISSATLSYLFAGGVEMLKSYLQYRREKREEAERKRVEVEKAIQERVDKAREEGREEGRREAMRPSTGRHTS